MYGKMTSSWATDGPPRLMEMGRMSANLAVGQVILQKGHRDSCPGRSSPRAVASRSKRRGRGGGSGRGYRGRGSPSGVGRWRRPEGCGKRAVAYLLGGLEPQP